MALQGSCRAWHVPGDEEPLLAGLGDPGTLTMPMEWHPYNLNARLREIYSLHCACSKMSSSTFRVTEDNGLEENHHSQSMKELGAGLFF